MNDNFTNTTLLIRLLDNELSPEEQESLEKIIAQDISLQEELENLRVTRQSVGSFGLRKQVAMIHKEMMTELGAGSKPVGTLRNFARIPMRVAAGIIVLLIAGGAYQYFTISPGRLFEENYKAYTIGTTRSVGELSPMEKAFKEEDFKSVINYFNSTPDPRPGDCFLAGNAYLQMEDLAGAIRQFNNCIDKNKAFQTSVYLEDAEYYLAISYLKNNEINKSLPLFEKIHSQPLHLYHDKVSNWFIKKVKVAAWKQ